MSNEPILHDEGDDEVEGFAFGAYPPGPPVRPVLDGIALPPIAGRSVRFVGVVESSYNANEAVLFDRDDADAELDGDDVEGFGLSFAPDGPPIKPAVGGVAGPSVVPPPPDRMPPRSTWATGATPTSR